MKPGIYNFKDQYVGTTFSPVQITLTRTSGSTTTPIDLTTVALQLKIGYILTLTIGSGITLIDAVHGIFRIDAFMVPDKAGVHSCGLEITYDDGSNYLYLKGNLTIYKELS